MRSFFTSLKSFISYYIQPLNKQALLKKLHLATINGDISTVKTIITDYPDMLDRTSITDYDYTSPGHLNALHYAAATGHAAIVEFLLEKNADVSKFTVSFDDNHQLGDYGDTLWRKDLTPLCIAALHGHENVVKLLLLNQGLSLINTSTDDRNTAIDFAAAGGHSSVVKLLIDNGAIINKRNTDKYTPLHYAAISGDEKTIKVLLENHAIIDPHYCNRTALHSAAANGHTGAIRLLLEHLKSLENLEDYHGIINQRDLELDSHRHTALHLAANNGNIDAVKLLLENGAEINQPNRFGKTPLDLAIINCHPEVVNCLMSCQEAKITLVDPDLRNSLKNTFYRAAMHGSNPKLIIALLQKIETFDASLFRECHNILKNSNSKGPRRKDYATALGSLTKYMYLDAAQQVISFLYGDSSQNFTCAKGKEKIDKYDSEIAGFNLQPRHR